MKYQKPPPTHIRHEREIAGSVMRKSWSTPLMKKISGEIRFDNGSRALYATDSSNYRQIPIGCGRTQNS